MATVVPYDEAVARCRWCGCVDCVECEEGPLRWPVKPGVGGGGPESALGCTCKVAQGVLDLLLYQPPAVGYSWDEPPDFFGGHYHVEVLESELEPLVCIRDLGFFGGLYFGLNPWFAGEMRVRMTYVPAAGRQTHTPYEEIRPLWWQGVFSGGSGSTLQTATFRLVYFDGTMATPVQDRNEFSVLLDRCDLVEGDSGQTAGTSGNLDGGRLRLRPSCCDLCQQVSGGCASESFDHNPMSSRCSYRLRDANGDSIGFCKPWPTMVRLEIDGVSACSWYSGLCDSLGSVSEKYTLTIPALDECVDSEGGEMTIEDVLVHEYFDAAGDCTGDSQTTTTDAKLTWGWSPNNGNFWASIYLDVPFGMGGDADGWRVWEKWLAGEPGSSPSADQGGWIFSAEVQVSCFDDGNGASYTGSNLVTCSERDGIRTAAHLGTLVATFCCS